MARRELTAAEAARLQAAESVWLATVRANSTAHLVPVWAVLHDGRVYIGTERNSQKVKNILTHGSAAIAIPDPDNVLIVEAAASLPVQVPEGVLAAFRAKYGWEIVPGEETVLVELVPAKVLSWRA